MTFRTFIDAAGTWEIGEVDGREVRRALVTPSAARLAELAALHASIEAEKQEQAAAAEAVRARLAKSTLSNADIKAILSELAARTGVIEGA